ncbi:MAG: hypothetical protein QG611_658 [Bacteroidota bacterium]|nr:hypothetical protein [Bacteroidota bacterium]
MVLKDILSISGEPGLFRFIAQGKNAIVIENLETKKRGSAFGSARVSSLEEISIFTEKEDMPLGKVLDLIFDKEKGGPAIDYKSDPEKLKAYFNEVLPEYDKDKVYVSDIRKVVHWYNILQLLDMLVKEEPEKIPEPETKKEEKTKKEVKTKKESATGKEGKESGKDKAAPKKKPAKPKAK